jgi:hypothetical protein
MDKTNKILKYMIYKKIQTYNKSNGDNYSLAHSFAYSTNKYIPYIYFTNSSLINIYKYLFNN